MDDSDTLVLDTGDGATQTSSDPEWRYVPVRRTQTDATGDSGTLEPLDLATADSTDDGEAAGTGHFSQIVWADTGF